MNQRHHHRYALLALGLALALPATLAAKFEIEILYDDGADFAAFETYRWVTEVPAESKDAVMVDTRIKKAANAALAQKGLSEVAAGEEADLLLTYYGGIEDNLLIEGVRYELAPHVVWTGADPLGVTRAYQVGTLVIDFADAETEKVVWSGVVVASARTASDLRAKIEKAVQKVMKRYPPQ